MEQSKIDIFLASNGRRFRPEHIAQIMEILRNSDENKYMLALSLDYKDPSTMLAISVLGGGLGIDRFMLDEVGLGVAKLLTAGGCGIWAIIDWFLIQDKTKDYNYRLFVEKMTVTNSFYGNYNNNSNAGESPKSL